LTFFFLCFFVSLFVLIWLVIGVLVKKERKKEKNERRVTHFSTKRSTVLSVDKFAFFFLVWGFVTKPSSLRSQRKQRGTKGSFVGGGDCLC
jgi:hypothetical protein